MRPVNLIPADERRGAARVGRPAGGVGAYVVIGVLGLALVGVLMLVLTSNKVSERKSKLAELTSQENAAKAQQSQFAEFGGFKQTAEQRFDAIYATARGRFNFERRLRQLSRAIPTEVNLTSLDATLDGSSGSSEGSGGSTSSSGSGSGDPASQNPQFEIEACTTKGKPSVALMATRMRNLDSVMKVTIGKIDPADSCAGGALGATTTTTTTTTSTTTASSGNPSKKKRANTFSITIEFKPPAGAAAGSAPGGSGATATQLAGKANGQSEAANQAAGSDQGQTPTPVPGATP